MVWLVSEEEIEELVIVQRTFKYSDRVSEPAFSAR